jgi:hypothetical protein
MTNRIVSTLSLAALAFGTARAQDTWTRITTSPSPPARQFHGLAFDAGRNEFVMFGGFGAGFAAIRDTWVFDGTTWTQRSPINAPAARGGHRMAYDAARGQVVLFGGGASFGAASFNDTWVWNGTDWTRLTPPTSPTARFEPGMCYDAQRQQIVLFGGGISGGTSNETWVWSGSDWTRLLPATVPAGRSAPLFGYDPVRARVVMFGGGNVNGSALRNDTLEWDGSNWTTIATAPTPVARFRGGLAFEPIQKRMLMFGGFTPFRNDTWSWNGTTWTQHTPAASPIPRDAFGFETDPVRSCVYLFGGDGQSTPQNDSWRYCARGLGSSFGSGCPDVNGATPALTTSVPAIGQNFAGTIQNAAPSQSVFLVFGASNQTWASIGLPFDLGQLGLTGCSLLVSFDVAVAGLADASGNAAISVPVPAMSSLLGTTFFNQAVTGLLAWSNGRRSTIGY